jgi:hypothetical protein
MCHGSGWMDGWVVRTRKPHRSEVSNINCFRNRKDCYGLEVIGGVDSDCRFRMLSIKSLGSTNDCVAWEFSNHYTDIIAKQLLPPKFFYIGDKEFVNTNNFLTPIGGNFLTPSEDGFNYHLSRMRQNVERVWISSHKVGNFLENFTMRLICVKLHNFGLDNNIEDDVCEEFDIEEHNDNVEAAVVITTSDGINRPNNLVDVEENAGRSFFAEERRKAIERHFAING